MMTQGTEDRAIAYVLDDDSSIGTLVTRMLTNIGYYAIPFLEMHECIKRIKEASEYSKPSLIVLDLALGKHDAIDVFDQLQKVGYKGRLLLMSGVDEAALKDVHDMCVSRGLRAYPPLKKPFRIDDLKQRLQEQTVGPNPDNPDTRTGEPAVSFQQAFATGAWMLCYQRKIDLRSGAPCGLEAKPYAQHPSGGCIPLTGAMPPPESPLYFPLARSMVTQVHQDWSKCFADETYQPPFSIKLPLAVVASRGFVASMREKLPGDPRFAGLVIEVTDAHQIGDVPRLWEVSAQLQLHHVSLSIADIGGAFAAIALKHKFPFREVKLNSNLVANCLLDARKQLLCQGIIDLAHSVDAFACAEGVSNAEQLRALVKMGCDQAQGDIAGKPQPLSALKLTGTASGSPDTDAWPATNLPLSMVA